MPVSCSSRLAALYVFNNCGGFCNNVPGVGAALLAAAENASLSAGKTLLVLDTASGDAERLYAKLGWQRCGVIPGYALLPGGGLCDTTFFYRTL